MPCGGLRPETVGRVDGGPEERGRPLPLPFVQKCSAERIKHQTSTVQPRLPQDRLAQPLHLRKILPPPARRQRIGELRLDVIDIETARRHGIGTGKRLPVKPDAAIEIMLTGTARVSHMDEGARMLRIAGKRPPVGRGVITPMRKLVECQNRQQDGDDD